MKRILLALALVTAFQALSQGGAVARNAGPGPEPSLVTGIRPGTKMTEPNWCTMNFIFSRGKRLFIGTAGHCVSKVGEPVSLLVETDIVIEVGQVVFRILDTRTGDDFALVSVKKGLHDLVDPQMAHWDGPTEPTSPNIANRLVHYVGHGTVIGTGGTPRAAWGTYSDDASYGLLDPTPAPGDSGAPLVLDTGEAVGIITNGGFKQEGGAPATGWGPTTKRILELLGSSFRLETV